MKRFVLHCFKKFSYLINDNDQSDDKEEPDDNEESNDEVKKKLTTTHVTIVFGVV